MAAQLKGNKLCPHTFPHLGWAHCSNPCLGAHCATPRTRGATMHAPHSWGHHARPTLVGPLHCARLLAVGPCVPRAVATGKLRQLQAHPEACSAAGTSCCQPQQECALRPVWPGARAAQHKGSSRTPARPTTPGIPSAMPCQAHSRHTMAPSRRTQAPKHTRGTLRHTKAHLRHTQAHKSTPEAHSGTF